MRAAIISSRLARAVPLLLLLVLIPGSAAAAQSPDTTLPMLELVRAFPALSFDRPVFLTPAGDGSGLLYVVEQAGVIHRIDPDAPDRSDVFLDVRARVSRDGNEEGLLGLAFAPAFADNGRFYVYYSAADPRRSVLSRFEVDSDGLADTGSEEVLLEVEQPFPNHNGGMIAFGPDGMLYVALGDGGLAGDPFGNGQNSGTLLGAILRIDTEQAAPGAPYAIPADNPFVGEAGARGEIWAYGLRNPWRFSFDRETGDLWTGDVGQNLLEEVNIVRRGANYGWNVMEGSRCFRAASCDTDDLQAPVAEYDHGRGCSVTGGYVYRGQRQSQLEGVYLYADFCSGRIWGLRHDGGNVTEQGELANAPFEISSFGEDTAGEVYVLGFDGGIYTIAVSPGQTPQTPTPTLVPTREPTATATLVPTPAGITAVKPPPTPTAALPAPPPPTSNTGWWGVAIVAAVVVSAGGLVYLVRRFGGAGRRG